MGQNQVKYRIEKSYNQNPVCIWDKTKLTIFSKKSHNQNPVCIWDKTKLTIFSKKSHNQNPVCIWDKTKLIYHLLNIKLYCQTAEVLSFMNYESEVANMSFVDNEIFDNVIVGEYRDDNGKIIKNVYTTKDDAALVIGLSTLENLLAKANSGVGRSFTFMTFDEADAMYGDEIRANYRKELKAKREAKLKAKQEQQEALQVEQEPVVSQITYEEANKLYGDKIRQEYQEELNKSGVVPKQSRKDVAKLNLDVAITAKKSQANRDKTVMIKLISYGKTKREIIEAQRFSRTKVEKFVKDLKDKVEKDGLEKAQEYVLNLVKNNSGVVIVNPYEDNKKVTNFVDLYHCSYKEVQDAVLEKKMNEEIKQRRYEEYHNKVQAEANQAAEEHMKHVDEELAKLGITRTPEKPVAKYDKDGDEIADIDSILSLVSGVDTSAPAPVETPDTSADVNSYIDKMNELQKKANRREQILPTRQEVYVSDSEADDWGE